MPDRILATINPLTLRWVREGIGMPLEIAADRIGVSADRLAAFEHGNAQPTVGQLRTIGRVYKRPAAFFYTATLPDHSPPVPDYRRLTPEEAAEPGIELADAIESARSRRLEALDLLRSLSREAPAFGVTATLDDAPDALAAELRARLGISLSQQRGIRDKYRTLRLWTNAVESAGVLVSQFSNVQVEVARGFSLSDRPLPIVSLNGKDSPRGKVFTLLHELAHVALGAGGICDLHDSRDAADRIEPFCNRVAAEFLVPAPSFLAEPLLREIPAEGWEDWRLQEIATSYGVSVEVILRRLLTFGRTTLEFYRAKRAEARDAVAAAEETGGFLAYFRRVLRDNGPSFTSLVLEAYRADLVTPTEVSRALGGINLKHLPAIEEALEGAGA